MPARIVSPVDLGMPPVVEKITQPLYDSVNYAAAATAGNIRHFQVALGGAEFTGTGSFAAKSLLSTNLDQAGQLSAPKLYTITAISSVWQQFGAVNTGRTVTTTIGTNFGEPTDLNDLRELFWHGAFKLHIGTKSYLDCPLWRIPGLYGVGGYASMDVNYTTLPTIPLWRTGFQQVGVRYSILPVPILIPSQQTFHTEVNYDVMISPFSATLPTPINQQRQWILLHGVLGREVQ